MTASRATSGRPAAKASKKMSRSKASPVTRAKGKVKSVGSGWTKPSVRAAPARMARRRAPADIAALPPVRLIDCAAAIEEAVAALRELDAELIGHLLDHAGPPPLRLREPGFEGLVWIILSQQVSVASADAIARRVKADIVPLEARRVLELGDDDLRACGLSGPKMRTLRALSAAIVHEGLVLDALATLPPHEAHGRLTAVKGIGPWTADIFLLFCLGHPDAWPAGDLALQEAARLALKLKKRPDEARLRKIAERWRPWRGVVARLLWSYYHVVKGRQGMALAAAAKASK